MKIKVGAEEKICVLGYAAERRGEGGMGWNGMGEEEKKMAYAPVTMLSAKCQSSS